MTALAWFCAAFIAYTYMGYALLLKAWPRRAARDEPAEGKRPSVSVIIAACNEAANIGRKLDNLAETEYPRDLLEILVGSDGSTDATDDIVGAHPVGARLARFERIGKTGVLNRLVSLASGDILVFMDARQRTDADMLNRFVAHFSDPGIACVGAELALVDERGLETSAGVGVYWKFEKWLRRRESDLGLLTGLSGALYAMRRDLFQAPPDEAILDDVMIPLAPARRGYRLIIDDAIHMYDRVADEDREFRRKVRTMLGNFQMFGWFLRAPRPFPLRLAFSLVSHKACRAFAPLAMIGLLAGSLGMPPGPAKWAFLFGQAIVYGVGAAALLSRGRLPGRLASVCSTFCVLNAAALVALLKYLSGNYRTAWK
ncbi:MAG TPA: glycosyltransferase family 2 protein [Armatimonadota bacterium]|jgi:cellulose synthase/poly-beta-1,6-N-acetylglucosamine synthase-like glycosyltransferase